MAKHIEQIPDGIDIVAVRSSGRRVFRPQLRYGCIQWTMDGSSSEWAQSLSEVFANLTPQEHQAAEDKIPTWIDECYRAAQGYAAEIVQTQFLVHSRDHIMSQQEGLRVCLAVADHLLKYEDEVRV